MQIVRCVIVAVALLVATAAQAAGTSRALLIGINQYKAVPALQGSINDIETMREVLTKRWGFPAAQVETLVGDAATREGMLRAFDRLIQSVSPDDTVYIHYSGHGSQVQDLNGDEADGLDETLVPQDGRSDGIPDIVDDELDTIFSRLRARSTVIVFDSCHSGTATRAVGFRTRSLPQDTRVDLYRAGVAAMSTRAIVPLSQQSRFVLMTGAADHQEALDGPVDGRYHGFFSYALSRSFNTAPSGASPRAIFAGVARELGRIQATVGRSSMPEPQLEAPPQSIDAPLFAPMSDRNAQQTARLSWLAATASGAGAVKLANGLLLGAAPGSTWAIYAPNETQFPPGRALATATVTTLSGNDANAQLDRNITIAASSRAIALLPAPSNGRIALRWADDPGPSRAQIEAQLSGHVPGVEWVGPQQPARFLVGVDGRDMVLMTADGLTAVARFAIEDASAVAEVARIVSRTTPAAELLALDNPSSRLRVTARVAADQRPTSRDIRLVADTSSMRLRSRRPGEPRSAANSLQLAISVSENAYLTIVDVDTEGRVNLLFPNAYQRAGFHTDGAVSGGGREVLIPDSLEGGNAAGFYWDYGPPPGTDTLRVFATTDLATAQMIRNRIAGLQQMPPPGQIASRSATADFTPLRADLTRVASRGIAVVADDAAGYSAPSNAPADWAATTVSVFVEE